MMTVLNGRIDLPIMMVILATIIFVIVVTEDVESTIPEDVTADIQATMALSWITIVTAISRGGAIKPRGVRIQEIPFQTSHVSL